MIRHYLNVLGFVVISSSTALGSPCDDHTAKLSSGLYALESSSSSPVSPTPSRWLKVVNGVALARQTIKEFAYLGRLTRSLPGSQGAIAIKFLTPVIQGQEAADSVVLRRSAEPSCGWRSWGYKGIFPVDFADEGQEVELSTYINYHISNVVNSSLLTRFHIQYQSETDGCVKTDTEKGYRRTAFLLRYHGHLLNSTRALIAAAGTYLINESKAASTNLDPSSEDNAGAVANEVRAFSSFASIETQIATYHLDGGKVCVLFNQLQWASNPQLIIEIVDLDDPRYRRGNFRSNWTINWAD